MSLASAFLLASPHVLFLNNPDRVSHLPLNGTREESPQEVSLGLLVWLVWGYKHPAFLGIDLEIAVFRPPSAKRDNRADSGASTSGEMGRSDDGTR